MANKYLDLVGLQNYHNKLKSEYFVDKIPNVINSSSQIINTTVLSGTPTPTGSGNTLANTDVVASTKWVLNQISGITEPMIFKGSATVASNGSIAVTDPASASDIKKGFTYKVTSVDEEYTGDIKVGDTLIANTNSPASSSDWVVVPSGDETGTFNAITVNGDGAAAITATGDGTETINLQVNAATNSAYGVVKGASTTNLGAVIVGGNIDVDTSTGTISVATATDSAKGVVQVGTNIDVASGVISVKTGSDSDKGVLQVGTNLDVASGVISVKTGSASDLGVLKVDNTTIKADNTGVINAEKAGAVAASAAEGTVSANLGTVKGSVDNGVLVDSNGVLAIATIDSTTDINALFA